MGWRVGILWEADGNYYEGEVLSFNSKSSKHHILYEDGEDEWVQLNKEVKCWRHKGRGASKPAGLAPGVVSSVIIFTCVKACALFEL